MSDMDNDVRRALEGMLGSVEPSPTLPQDTLRRARTRRTFLAVIAASAIMIVGAVTWIGVVAPQQEAFVDGPSVGGNGPTEVQETPRLYLAGDGELWVVDLETGVTHVEMEELAPGDPPVRIVRRGDDLVAWGYATYLLDPPLIFPPQVLVHDSLFFIPSAHDERVWVGIADPDSEDGGLKAVREVSVTGEITVPDVRPPDGYWPERALTAGLVFGRREGMIVWDPVSEEIVYRFQADDLGPTHDNLIASCAIGCSSIQLTDVGTGSVKTVDPPPGFAAFDVWAGAFSPDGATLAVPVRTELRDPNDTDALLQLALVDVAGGTTTLVEHAGVLEPYNFITWSPAGDYVFFTGTDQDGERCIVSYRLDDRLPAKLQIEVGEFFGAAAL